MTVRGWIIVGERDAARGLPPAANASTTNYLGNLPDAALFEPGRWILWTPVPDAATLCLVCVEIPL